MRRTTDDRETHRIAITRNTNTSWPSVTATITHCPGPGHGPQFFTPCKTLSDNDYAVLGKMELDEGDTAHINGSVVALIDGEYCSLITDHCELCCMGPEAECILEDFAEYAQEHNFPDGEYMAVTTLDGRIIPAKPTTPQPSHLGGHEPQ